VGTPWPPLCRIVIGKGWPRSATPTIVGTDGKDLHFSSLRLGQWPEIVSRYTRKGASQGELRSHGFFYKPDGDETGMLGLPISVAGRAGYKHLFENSAAILFLRNNSLQFSEVGELGSQPDNAVDDQCRASCVDWYGNARRCFCVVECSRCSVMRSSKADSTMAACTSFAG
jgi:hypothetical protein